MDVDTAILSMSGARSELPPSGSIRHSDTPCLELGNRIFRLVEGGNLVGRSDNAAVRLESSSVSRRHALITITGSVATLEDLSSRNGTVVRSERVHSEVALDDGDAIRIGTVWLVFRGPRRGDASSE